jgi:hypothetical protein
MIFRYTGTVHPAIVSVLSLVICVCVSIAIFERYEHPLRVRIRAALSSRPARSAVAAA